MSLLQPYLDGKSKVEVCIERIKCFEPPDGYFLNFSGGKDSVVLYDLTRKAGVKFEAYYCRTGVDPPELIYFIRQFYPSVIWLKPEITMWQGILLHGLPTRKIRWCCEALKEFAGKGRLNLTGIRWEESTRRKKRKLYEVCLQDKTKRYFHPIIDLSNSEVWEYISINNLPYCKLYDEGFKRIGCILCPMQTNKKRDLERFPKICQAWYRAGERRFKERPEVPLNKKFKSFEDLWDWWLSGKGIKDKNDCQRPWLISGDND